MQSLLQVESQHVLPEMSVCDVFKGLYPRSAMDPSCLLFTGLVYKLILVAVDVITRFFHR